MRYLTKIRKEIRKKERKNRRIIMILENTEMFVCEEIARSFVCAGVGILFCFFSFFI